MTVTNITIKKCTVKNAWYEKHIGSSYLVEEVHQETRINGIRYSSHYEAQILQPDGTTEVLPILIQDTKPYDPEKDAWDNWKTI